MARSILVACVALVLLSGCAGYGGAGYGSAQGISNQTNAFSYGGAMSKAGGIDTETWQNTMGKAHIAWSGATAEGYLQLTIKDSVGHTVYSKRIDTGSGGFSGNSDQGTPGAWKVIMDFEGFTGSMGLTLSATA